MALLTIIFGIFVFGIVALLGYIYYVAYKHRKYFQQWGVPYNGSDFHGFFGLLAGRVSIYEIEQNMYKRSKETNKPFAGFTDALVHPAVYITDLDLLKNIYVKDFDHFVNRRTFTTQKGDLLFHRMVAMMEDEQWKGMRNKLSPTFTTGKIRKMFQIFNKSSDRMCDYLGRLVGPNGTDFDIPNIFSKYAMDVIASCVFGIDNKSFDYEPGKLSEFEEMGQLLQFKIKALSFIKLIFILAAPKLADMLGLQFTDPTPQLYFRQVIQQVMKRRRETGERQEDFLQLMMDIQKGLLKDDENSKEVLEVMTGGAEGQGWGEDESKKLKFDDDDIAANCVLFLLAGFDTLQSVLIFSAYALALEQEVQQKLLEEIKESMAANGGKLTYDGVHEMKYLDLFINETLRFYPPAGRAERRCTKDYHVPGTNAVIEKGVLVALPILPIHRDPELYENSDKFIPERFLPERKNERHPYAFAPFGHGPRNCIGMRFALTEVKTVICSLVSKFKLEPCGRTDIPLKFANTTTLRPMNGMWLQIRPRSEQ